MRSPSNRAGAAPRLAVALGGLLGLSACPSQDPCQDNLSDPACLAAFCAESPGDPACPQPGPELPARSQAIATVDRPLCAVVDGEGKTVYFAAYDDDGRAQLYSVPVAGGPPALLQTGGALSHPVGMAMRPDGGALFVADLGDPGGTGDETGAIYRVALPGEARPFTMGELRAPAGVAVSADGQDVYVTGVSRDDGQPGVWRFPAAGGAPVLLHKGAPLSDPSGAVVGDDGALYVIDPTALGPREGAVLKVEPGAATILSKAPLTLGYPAGIAAAGIGHGGVLVTATRPKDGKGVVYRVTPAGDVSEVAAGAAPSEPGTLQRAARANVWVGVDSLLPPPAPGSDKSPGQLFQLTP